MSYITFAERFYQQVDLHPPCLTHLTFGTTFNSPVIYLTHLTYGSSINLSPSHLKFGNLFNHSVNNLPSSSVHFIFDNEFNQPSNLLPHAVTRLTLSKKINQSPPPVPHRASLGSPLQPLPPSPPLAITSLTFLYGENLMTEISNLFHLSPTSQIHHFGGQDD